MTIKSTPIVMIFSIGLRESVIRNTLNGAMLLLHMVGYLICVDIRIT